jgi:hypothetical protein
MTKKTETPKTLAMRDVELNRWFRREAAIRGKKLWAFLEEILRYYKGRHGKRGKDAGLGS